MSKPDFDWRPDSRCAGICVIRLGEGRRGRVWAWNREGKVSFGKVRVERKFGDLWIEEGERALSTFLTRDENEAFMASAVAFITGPAEGV